MKICIKKSLNPKCSGTSEKPRANASDTSDDEKNESSRKGDKTNEGNNHPSLPLKLDSSAAASATTSSIPKVSEKRLEDL